MANETQTMATQDQNNPSTHGKQQGNKGSTRVKQPMNRASTKASDRQHSYVATVVVAVSASNLASDKFPLYKPFTLAADSSDLYIKVNKSTIVHLLTQERFALEKDCYFVNIQLTGGK